VDRSSLRRPADEAKCAVTGRAAIPLGHLDHAVVSADRERAGQAVDALLENAVRHTGTDDVITLSVARSDHYAPAASGAGGPGDRRGTRRLR
jgi:signal transduction histidine kinase